MNQSDTSATASALRSPDKLRGRLQGWSQRARELVRESRKLADEFDRVNRYLDIADDVTNALDKLNEQLFTQLLGIVEEKLTIALQEILDQPVKLKARSTFKRDAAQVEFYIERNGCEEDILRGQGGSVANILSVGLRMFALMTLDEAKHRRFLVLDEQDCWIRPDLVPRLVKIVHDAGKSLGFQVLMISHHDSTQFEQYADRIYRFFLNSDGAVEVEQVVDRSMNPDQLQ